MEYDARLAIFGRFLRERRKELGLTQTQLGDRVGWAQERISVLEHGKYGMPSLPQLCRLADALEISLQEVLHHIGVAERPIAHSRSDDASDSGKVLFSHQLTAMAGQMRVVEERLHAAENRMVRVETLRDSIREQRERMGALLSSCREPEAGAP